MSTPTFDLRRVSTVVSPSGRVHITEGSLWTLCGRKLSGMDVTWSENLSDRQPDCARCRRAALLRPTLYPYSEPGEAFREIQEAHP